MIPSFLHHDDVNKPEQSKTCRHGPRHVDHWPHARLVHRQFMDEMVSHAQQYSYPPAKLCRERQRALSSYQCHSAGGRPLSGSNNTGDADDWQTHLGFTVQPLSERMEDHPVHSRCLSALWRARFPKPPHLLPRMLLPHLSDLGSPTNQGRSRPTCRSRKTGALEPLDECSFVQRNHLTFVRVRAASVPTASFVTSAIFPRSLMSTTASFSTAHSLAPPLPHFCDRPSSSPLTSQELSAGH